MIDRPNVLVVMTDDHAQWALGAYGNGEVRTPTLDHLADAGVRMENAFCPTPVCSPSRASFFTGRTPSQHGVHDYLAGAYSDASWLDDEGLLPELLGEAGYETALFGKWHAGLGREREAFDRVATPDHDDWESDVSTVASDREATDRALAFLAERDGDAPFFLFVGLTATHGPWEGGPERLVDPYRGSGFPDVPDDETYRYARVVGDPTVRPVGSATPREGFDQEEALAQYYGAAQGVDEQVGRLIDALEAGDALEETLVVYTADHGMNCGHHGTWGKGNGTRPLNLLEESIRVPLLVAGHADLFKEQVRGEFVDHCDLFATLADAAGVDLPADRAYPGRSYLPMLARATGTPDWKDVQICEYGDLRMARDDRHKLVRGYPDGPTLLFDLRDDPRETRNVAERPAHADARERLRDAVDAHFETYAEADADGARVRELRQHNDLEAWRGLEEFGEFEV